MLDWLKDCKKNGEIFDANIKSYERESARYGGPQLIEMAESVFWRDSQLVIKMLDIFEHESVDNQKILVVLSVIKILEDLGFTREAQLELLDTYVDKNLYKQEFSGLTFELLVLLFPCARGLPADSILAYKGTDTSKSIISTDIGIVLTTSIGLRLSIHLVKRSVKRDLQFFFIHNDTSETSSCPDIN